MANKPLSQIPFLRQRSRRWEEMPQPQTEESLLLRVLVQALVIVGIIATDIAAETQMSLWAIPLSIAGAMWSWYRRREKNISTKFLIAIGMLVALVFFLGNLVASLNDSRLVLAELLVQLQVLHSFDLPRRKDLGYSMVIGLILLGVAGTLSQTFAFAPWLIVFLAIALPTLILDYRSRLGLENIARAPSRFAKVRPNIARFSPLAPQRLLVFLTIVIGIGLAIFAVMPRFPGYQLQTFPVSSPIDMEDRTFNDQNRDVINPGYVREGKPSQENGTGGGTNLEQGAGELDRTYYYGFNSQMNQNLRGTLEEQVVLRVRSQAPGFWRVMSFDRYTGQGWEISRNDQLQNIKRARWSYRFFIAPPLTRAKTRQVIQSYTAVSELPNVMAALAYPRYVFFPTPEIAVDPEGSLRSPAGLMKDMTYTVISQVPYRDRTLLGQASQNYPKRISDYYLQVPPEIKDKVRQQAEALLAKSPQPLTSDYEKSLFLTQALKQNYEIQANFPFLGEKEDLVNAFLRYKGGYPDHFSTVLTVMLRSLGIPARLTVGFAPGQFNAFTGFYIVRNTDAHALTEVYFPDYGWFAFDPIPGHELIPPSFEEDQTFSVLKQFWNWVASWLPSPVVSFFNILWSEIIGGFLRILAWLWRFISGSFIGVLVGSIGAIALGFLVWLTIERSRSWGYGRRLAKLPPMERLYRQMLQALKAKGYPKQPAQTPIEYVRTTSQHHSSAAAEIIDEISQAYVRWRYGEQTQNIDYLRQQLKALIRNLQRLKI
jgi:transglutaminase-like putative cysteine protease